MKALPGRKGHVSGSSALLQTSDAEVGGLMEGKLYQDLPLTMTAISIQGSGRRQPDQFVLLGPGASSLTQGDVYGKNFNGAMFLSGLALVDGVSTPRSLHGGQMEMTSPPYESLEEFKVQSAVLPAEIGGGSALEQFTMRSGTNNYHGDVFEFIRNRDLTARGFLPLPVEGQLEMNEFGGTIGGPVVVRHLYNGRNRTFFFGSIENFRLLGAPPSAPVYAVPTASEREGDFSALLQPANGGIQIYDPSTTTYNSGTQAWTRTPFPNNMLVNPTTGASEINSAAAYLLPIIRLPNLPGQFSNFLDNLASTTSDWVWSAKVDEAFNERHRISWSYWGNDTYSAANGDYEFRDTSPYTYWWTGGGHRIHDYYGYSPNIENDAYIGFSNIYGVTGCAPGTEVNTANPAGIPNLQDYYPTGTGQYRWVGTSPVTYFRPGAGLTSCITYAHNSIRVNGITSGRSGIW